METNKQILERYKEYRKANNKSKKTLLNDDVRLGKLLKTSNNKHFSEITEKDSMKLMNTLGLSSKPQYASTIIKFYRWYKKLGKTERPEHMKWFEYPSQDLLTKNSDPDRKKYLITDEEYSKIIQHSKHDPKWSALYETLYLSGGRPDEINRMKYEDVSRLKIESIIIIRDSKTIPRNIALTGRPEQLIRWMEMHPTQNPKDPLFPSYAGTNKMNHMATNSINVHFNRLKEATGIKKTLSPHCYRKTRATIMFGSRNPTFDDTEIGQYFGWKAHTVIQRREQYDLRGEEELQKKIRGIQPTIDDYDTIKALKETLEKKHAKEIEDLKQKMQEILDRIPGLDLSKPGPHGTFEQPKPKTDQLP